MIAITSLSLLLFLVGLVLLFPRRTRRAGKWLAMSGLAMPLGAAIFLPGSSGELASIPVQQQERALSPVTPAGSNSRAAPVAVTAAEAPPKFMPYGEGTSAQNLRNMRAMEAVRSRLRDPESAKFQNVFLHQGKAGVPVSCGEVNSRNGFGGFSGFESFVSNGVDVTVLASDFRKSAEFRKIWAQFCQ